MIEKLINRIAEAVYKAVCDDICIMDDKIDALRDSIDKAYICVDALQNEQEICKQAFDVALCNYSEGLHFTYYNNKPVVFNNGKMLTNNYTDSVTISWSRGDLPTISIEESVVVKGG